MLEIFVGWVFWVILGLAESRLRSVPSGICWGWSPAVLGGSVSPVSLFCCACTVWLEHGAHLPARTGDSCRKQLIRATEKIPCPGGSDWKRGCPEAAPAHCRVAENPWGEWSHWWSFVKLELPWFWGEVMWLLLKWQVPPWRPFSLKISVRRIPPVFKNSFVFSPIISFLKRSLRWVGFFFWSLSLSVKLSDVVADRGDASEIWSLQDVAVFHGWDVDFPNVNTTVWSRKGKQTLENQKQKTQAAICVCVVFFYYLLSGVTEVPSRGHWWLIREGNVLFSAVE